MTRTLKQIHLGAIFPGVNNTTVWTKPIKARGLDFDVFANFAQTAERAKFDFLFLAEGLRLREERGRIYDLDIVDRPDNFTILAALAAVTNRLGLAATISSTFNEPYEVARQFASLDHLSAGRAAWNVVTSWDSITGDNFRRGNFLPYAQRYDRAKAFLAATWQMFDSWANSAIVADKNSGTFLISQHAGCFRIEDEHFEISGQFNVPTSPQGRPVVFQAGDSSEGREFAASSADAIFSRHSETNEGQAFYADVKRRLRRHGRTSNQLLILPAATFAIGDTDADSVEIAHELRRQQVTGQVAIRYVEQLWNRDFSGYDPEGPLPDIKPNLPESGDGVNRADVCTIRELQAKAAERNLSIRELVIEETAWHMFAGAPETVARAISDSVQRNVGDGFILVPPFTPGGLEEFADRVVPILQEWGVFRSEYSGLTLRDHLGLGAAQNATVTSH